MTTSEDRSVMQEFRLSDLAEEFANHGKAEIERLRSDNPDFDEDLYQQAVALVLRKLSQHAPREIS